MNYITFFEGFLLGIGAAVPIGPINILIMNTAVKSYKNGVLIGLGAMSADLLYFAFVFLGFVALLNGGEFDTFFGIFGSIFLIYIAFLMTRTVSQNEAQINIHSLKSLLAFYLRGFVLTIFNPYTIGFWMSIAGYIGAKNLDFVSMLCGMFLAILSWILLMPYVINKIGHKISPNISNLLNKVAAVILIGFAISLVFGIF